VKAEIDNKEATPARTYRAPGRVNLIGEHTDYNDGFVMPAAIEFSTFVTVSPREDRKLSLFSENFSEQVEFDLDDPDPRPAGHWSDYPRGVAVTLERTGYRLNGASLRIRGEVPIGSGLSSSAAIEVAACYALVANSALSADPVKSQSFASARKMSLSECAADYGPVVSCCGQAGKALMLDCRSLDYKLLPLPQETRLVICNTMVKHALASGEYNIRRAECEAGVRHFAQSLPNVRALRDVNEADLKHYGNDCLK